METNQRQPFPCNGCGSCCRLVANISETAWLDRGDSVCKYLDEQSNRCTIYSNRPLVCRVEDYYLAHLSSRIAWDDFVKVNLEVCEKL